MCGLKWRYFAKKRDAEAGKALMNPESNREAEK